MDFIALKEGTILNHGTYVIRKILGKGGFGITYLAHDTSLDKDVAIKEFFPSALCGREGSTNHITLTTRSNAQLVTELKNKFLKEARNIAKLNHPNIIRIYAAFEENNTAYYVMEYIKGDSLGQIVKKHGPMPQDVALNYINQIGNALEYLHSSRMTHLDVKPANIMVRTSDRCPVLIDFGLSKNYDSTGTQTTTHGPLGVSPGYSPIEQYNMTGRLTFSPRSDLYSLAATLYYLLTAQTPPEAMANVSSRLPFPPDINSNVKEALITAMSMMADQRHETIKEFLNHLNRADYTPSNTYTESKRHGEETRYMGNERDNENTRVNTADRGDYQQQSPYHGYEPYTSPYQKKNGSSKNMVLTLVVCCVVVVCFISLWAIFRKGETPKVQMGNVTEDVSQPTQRNKSESIERAYGPFDSREEVKDFISNYSEMTLNNNIDPDVVADRITTDYGHPNSYTRSEFVKKASDHNERFNVISSDRNIKWDQMKISSDGNGGIKVSYPSIFTLTVYKDYREVSQRLSLHTDAYINSHKQLYKYKEKSKKIAEW